MTALRQAAEMALEALEITSSEYCQGCWLEVIAALKEALAQLDKKCEAGVSLQDLWDCWDAVHGVGQEPVAWIRESDLKLLNGDLDCCLVSATRDFTDRVPLYLHPAPIPEGWVEAAIAWEVCASIHRKWAKGKDALYSTRQADFVKHAEHARAMLAAAPKLDAPVGRYGVTNGRCET